MKKRWQDDKLFVKALHKRKYLYSPDPNDDKPMQAGMYLYLYEMYCDGKEQGRKGERRYLVKCLEAMESK